MNISKNNTRRLTLPDSVAMYGKVPPQAMEIEEQILGAIMLYKEAFDLVSDLLKPECFYKESNQIIYQSFLNLQLKNSPVDMFTVCDELLRMEELENVGGRYGIMQITMEIFGFINIEAHAKIVYQKFIQRELIRVAGEIINKAYDDSSDAFEILDMAEKSIDNISIGANPGLIKIDAVLMQAVKKIDEWRQNEDALTGIPSGFHELDMITRGWQPGDLIIIGARPSIGKCLGKGTKILMFDGSLKKVEDIIHGDMLMGPDSKKRKVLSVCHGSEKMFHVKQLHGIDYRVNESHILSLKRSKNEGNKKHGEILNISVSDYNKKGPGFISRWKGYKVPVDFKEKSLVVPPYLLGIWLGDGSLNKTEITKPDIEIENYLSKYCEENGNSLSIHTPENRCKSYSVIGLKGKFRNELRELGVFDNKHIPNDYLINSKENRLELLAGLLDTDGYYIKHSHGYEICQKLKRLAFQIKFLADTLGFKTSIGEKIVNGVTYYRMTIWGDIDIIPLKIERKKAAKIEHKRDWRINSIKVEFDKIDTYYGFEIDGDGLFLLADCTVTHNTALALNMARNAAINDRRQAVVAFWSLEMKAIFLAIRMIAAESKIFLYRLLTGRLSDDDMNLLMKTAINTLSKAGIFFDENTNINISSMARKARKLKRKNKLGLIIVDYLQLMKGEEKKNGNREQDISYIARELKNLAQELEIPVIALSQLDRVKGAQNISWKYGPPLTSLRESGAIEQHADVVLMLWGPSDEDIAQDPTLVGRRKIRAVKQRNGMLVTVELDLIGEIQLFSEIASVTGERNPDQPFVSKGVRFDDPDAGDELPF